LGRYKHRLGDFDWFSQHLGLFRKEKEFNLWLDQIEKLGIKTLNPIAIIKQNKHKFYLREMEQQGIKYPPFL
jgi:hypothetical protein